MEYLDTLTFCLEGLPPFLSLVLEMFFAHCLVGVVSILGLAGEPG